MATDRIKKVMSILLASILLVMTVLGCGGATGISSSDDNQNNSNVTSYKKAIVRDETATAPASKELNNHKLVTENNNYALYLNEEVLSIIVYDKHTGEYMESSPSYDDGKVGDFLKGAMRSGVVLKMIYGIRNDMQADLCNDITDRKITYTDDGFSAEIYWTKYKLGLTLEVKLLEDGIVARVPDESIREDGDRYYFGSISIYPYMGSTYLDSEDGYMFIPDGNGALIYMDDKEGRFNSGYSSWVYGEDVGFDESKPATLLWDRYEVINDAYKVLAPIYGMAHTESEMAYLAIIEEGQERAIIEAFPNGAGTIAYNRVYTWFTSRRIYSQPAGNSDSTEVFKVLEEDRSHSDLQIRFVFLSGDTANYCGMANAYRDYLFEKGDIVACEDNTYRTRIDFLGAESESWVIGTKIVPMTTIENIESIYAELKNKGITDIFSVYKGWQKGGLYNLPIDNYKTEDEIGEAKELTALIKAAEEDGIKLYLYDDALRINPDENNATFNTIKRINKVKYEEDTFKDVYEEFMFLTPARTDELLGKFVSKYTGDGVYNLALGGISNNVFSYTYNGKTYSRYDCADNYATIVSGTNAKTNLVLEQPFVYLWDSMEAFLDMPLYTSSYIYEDEFVPFLSIVLKGVVPVYSEYVNFEANKQEFFLKMIETGSFPSFYITEEASSDLIDTNSNDIYSSQYSVYKDTIMTYASELKAVNDKVSNAYIIGHEIGENGLTVVTYDNGVKIYVNYSPTEISADGHTIAGMSYKVVE